MVRMGLSSSLNAESDMRVVAEAGSGEEALDAYRKHRPTLVLIMDGAQMPVGFELHGRDDLEAPAEELLSGLAVLSAGNIVPGGDLTSDDESFVVAGVPTLRLSVVEGDNDTRHHSITDTLDKIDARAFALDTAVLAIASHAIASADQRLGRRLSPREVDDLLKRTRQAEYVELDFGRRAPQEP